MEKKNHPNEEVRKEKRMESEAVIVILGRGGPMISKIRGNGGERRSIELNTLGRWSGTENNEGIGVVTSMTGYI